MKNLTEKTSYKTLYEKLLKKNNKKPQWNVSSFADISNEIIFHILSYLDITSSLAFASSCKLLYLTFIGDIVIANLRQNFLSVKKLYNCENWGLTKDLGKYFIEGDINLYSVQWSPEWVEQIESEISKFLIHYEISVLCNNVAEGVQVQIAIKLPEEFKFNNLEELSKLLQLPVSPPQIEEENLSEGFLLTDTAATETETENWILLP